MAPPKFLGFYLFLRDKRESVDTLLWEFYSQLLQGLKNNQKFKVPTQDGKLEPLTDKFFSGGAGQDLAVQMQGTSDDFVIFRGSYVRLFQDGVMLFNILRFVIQTLGDSTVQLEDKRTQYQSVHKKWSSLRACYWYVDTNFVSQLPSEYQVAFTVDCLLYGEWRVDHPNLVGLHLLALTWMLGLRQFGQFMPAEMLACEQVARPIFQHFLPQAGIKIQFSNAADQPAENKAQSKAPVAKKH